MLVANYIAIAASAFRRRAGRRYRTLCKLGLREDYQQESAIVALVAERQRLDARATFRMARREADQALRHMGWHGRNRDQMDMQLQTA